MLLSTSDLFFKNELPQEKIPAPKKIKKDLTSNSIYSIISYRKRGNQMNEMEMIIRQVSENTDIDDLERIVLKTSSFKNFDIGSGASKICLIDKNSAFVVKWAKHDWDYSKEEDEGEKEIYLYKQAMKEGLQFLFPTTEQYLHCNDITFVKQEKCISCEEISEQQRQKMRSIIKTATLKNRNTFKTGMSISGDWYDRELDKMWCDMILTIYGKRVAKRLCEFVHKFNINDLRRANLGYTRNLKPIILDFSGYHRN